MKRTRQKRWHLVLAAVIMLAAMVAYVVSIDESDPDAVPDAIEGR